MVLEKEGREWSAKGYAGKERKPVKASMQQARCENEVRETKERVGKGEAERVEMYTD